MENQYVTVDNLSAHQMVSRIRFFSTQFTACFDLRKKDLLCQKESILKNANKMPKEIIFFIKKPKTNT